MVCLIFLRSFLHNKFKIAGFVLEIATTGLIVAAYITIYITQRVTPSPK